MDQKQNYGMSVDYVKFVCFLLHALVETTQQYDIIVIAIDLSLQWWI